MSALGDSVEGTAVKDRRRGADRRIVARRVKAGERAVSGLAERRGSERRSADRRDVPALFCPDCHQPMKYEAGLSWYLADTYTVDAGYCPSCLRRFLRDRETGGYDNLAW